jgi:hypothetical protein
LGVFHNLQSYTPLGAHNYMLSQVDDFNYISCGSFGVSNSLIKY